MILKNAVKQSNMVIKNVKIAIIWSLKVLTFTQKHCKVWLLCLFVHDQHM